MRSVLATLCATVFALVSSPVSADGEIRGAAKVIDGDTLEVAGVTLDLYGIEAPTPGQVCHTRKRKNPYDCGAASAEHLGEIVSLRTLECSEMLRREDGRMVAKCMIGRIDVAEQHVLQGWATYDGDEVPAYVRAEHGAMAVREGLWKGDYTRGQAR